MIFPIKTQVNRIMPKAKFAKMVELNAVYKNEFIANIERLILANILREDTLNIKPGEKVEEINVFEIKLKKQKISDNIIKSIETHFPRNLVIILRYNNKAQVLISYKEKNQNNSKYKVLQTYSTQWLDYSKIKLDILGLNLDNVYDNFIKQIAEDKFKNINQDNNISQLVDISVNIEKLEKKTKILENKMKNEKQFNKQLEIKKELKALKIEMENIKNG